MNVEISCDKTNLGTVEDVIAHEILFLLSQLFIENFTLIHNFIHLLRLLCQNFCDHLLMKLQQLLLFKDLIFQILVFSVDMVYCFFHHLVVRYRCEVRLRFSYGFFPRVKHYDGLRATERALQISLFHCLNNLFLFVHLVVSRLKHSII